MASHRRRDLHRCPSTYQNFLHIFLFGKIFSIFVTYLRPRLDATSTFICTLNNSLVFIFRHKQSSFKYCVLNYYSICWLFEHYCIDFKMSKGLESSNHKVYFVNTTPHELKPVTFLLADLTMATNSSSHNPMRDGLSLGSGTGQEWLKLCAKIVKPTKAHESMTYRRFPEASTIAKNPRKEKTEVVYGIMVRESKQKKTYTFLFPFLHNDGHNKQIDTGKENINSANNNRKDNRKRDLHTINKIQDIVKILAIACIAFSQ